MPKTESFMKKTASQKKTFCKKKKEKRIGTHTLFRFSIFLCYVINF